MEYKLKLVDPAKSREFFEKKLSYTVGPMEVKYFQDEKQPFNIIDVRAKDDYEEEHVPGVGNTPGSIERSAEHCLLLLDSLPSSCKSGLLFR